MATDPFYFDLISEVKKVLEMKDNLALMLLLESVLQNQNAGKKGGGLTSSARREELWVDMLTSNSPHFKEDNPGNRSIEADYYFKGNPISHKEVGWKGGGDIAISWSKNPPGGLQRRDINSPIAVVMLRDPSLKPYLKNGYYVVPFSYLKKEVEPYLTSNNKSDNIVKSRYLFGALMHSQENGLFIPMPYNHNSGKNKHLSDWFAGTAGVREKPIT